MKAAAIHSFHSASAAKDGAESLFALIFLSFLVYIVFAFLRLKITKYVKKEENYDNFISKLTDIVFKIKQNDFFDSYNKIHKDFIINNKDYKAELHSLYKNYFKKDTSLEGFLKYDNTDYILFDLEYKNKELPAETNSELNQIKEKYFNDQKKIGIDLFIDQHLTGFINTIMYLLANCSTGISSQYKGNFSILGIKAIIKQKLSEHELIIISGLKKELVKIDKSFFESDAVGKDLLKKFIIKVYLYAIMDNYFSFNYNRKLNIEHAIGCVYERYIGYLFEKNGYEVKYNGIENKKNDYGIDLIASRHNEIVYVQCKFWKKMVVDKYLIDKFNLDIASFHNPDSKLTVIKQFYCVFANRDIIDYANDRNIAVLKTELEKNYDYVKCCEIDGYTLFSIPADIFYDAMENEKVKRKYYYLSIEQAMKNNFAWIGYEDLYSKFK